MPMRLLHTRLLLWADGMALGPRLVLIHPRARGDAGLLAHEAVHCEQMQREGTLRFLWKYATSRAYRLQAEVEAYRASLRHHPGHLPYFARMLARGYFLRVSEQEAQRLLRGGG